MKIVFFFIMTGLIIQCTPAKNLTKATLASDEISIRQVMDIQEKAWNRGDIPGFMEGYWKSDSLTFIGSKGISYGWDITLANYKKSYPDKSAMGELHFDILKLTRLAPDVFQMIGRYTLYREKDEPTGLFTLIWRKIDGRWLIVSDQTC